MPGRKKEKIINKVLRESLPILLLTVLGEAFAGSILGKMENAILLVPGVFVLIPAILDLRGDVGASFGSRMSSMLHIGLIPPKFKKSSLLLNNIAGSFSLSFSFSAFFGILAHFLCLAFHLPSAGITRLTLIGLMSGIISSLFMVPLTLFLSIFTFRRGIDPDNVISPAIAVFGDAVAMSAIFLSTILIRKWPIPDMGIYIVLLLIAKESFPSRYKFYKIFAESSPIILICGFLGIFSGLFLHYHESSFSSAPYLLVLVPQIIALGGSIGSIAGMRFTSSLYIGRFKPFQWNNYVSKNLFSAILLSFAIFIPVALVSYLSARILSIGHPNFLFILLITAITLIPLSIAVSIISYFLACGSMKAHLDPSNVVVPLITSIGDVSGVFLFLSLLHLFKI